MKIFTLKSDLPIFPVDSKSVEGNYEVLVQANEVSDGYHTMHELYQHRMALFAALIKAYSWHYDDSGEVRRTWKSKLHSDGQIPFGDSNYFICGLETEVGQITYHMKINEWWDKIIAQELDKAPTYDGHTSNDVIERLLKI